MSNPMLKGIHRRSLGIGYDDQVMAPYGLETGGDGYPTISLPSWQTVSLFDDFLGDLIADEWAVVESDTGYSAAIVTATNGVLRLTGSETAGVTHEAAAALTQGLMKQWKAGAGPGSMRAPRFLRLTARVKISGAFTDTGGGRPHVYVGFSDSGGAETPAYDTGVGVLHNAASHAGFLYSPSGLVTYWNAVTQAGAVSQASAVRRTPVQNVYDTLALELRSGGGGATDTGLKCHFWINGVKVGVVDAPGVVGTTALTPWIGVWEQDTGQATQLDIDYVAISGTRDTGE